MANKPTINTFSGNARIPTTELNENFNTLATAIQNCLGRGGTNESPNSMSGTLDMNLNKIQNLQDPSNDQDAATKAYVDSVQTVVVLESGVIATVRNSGDAVDWAAATTTPTAGKVATWDGMPVIDSRLYGTTGAGLVDETSFLAAAISAGAGKRIFIPNGTYLHTGLTISGDNTELILSENATLSLMDSSNVSSIIVTGDNVRIFGGSIDGNSTNQAAVLDTSHGIEFQSVTGGTVENVAIDDTRGSGIRCKESSFITIKRNKITNTFYIPIFSNATAADNSDINVIENIVDQSAQTPADVDQVMLNVRATDPYYCSRVKVIGNTVKHVSSPTSANSICIENKRVKYGCISNNTTSYGSMGISVADNSELVAVGNNSILCSSSFYGIEIANSFRIAVFGNTIDGLGTLVNGIILDGTVVSKNIAIAGNQIYNVLTNGIATVGFSGDICTDVSVVGNTIQSTTRGVNLKFTERFTVSGNTIDTPAAAGLGVLIDKGAFGAITGNTVVDAQFYAVRMVADTAYNIENINISGNSFPVLTATNTISLALSGGGTASGDIKAIGNTNTFDRLDVANNIIDIVKSGTPEGATVAGIGSVCRRTNGGAGTTFYVKESGTGNTGWVGK